MSLLQAASSELFRRQSDDRFATLAELREHARGRQERARTLSSIPTRALIFTAGADDDAEPLRLTIDHPAANSVPPKLALTNYSLGQFATAARAPLALLERLNRPTMAQVLNQAIRHPDCALTDRSILIDRNGGNPHIRAITSDRYARVWDAELFDEVARWLEPSGFKPAVPTFNYSTERPTDIFGDTRPALWSGDRDSFAFFYTDPDPNGRDFGGLRRGIYVGNSEVGARSLHFSTFLFRDVCANFLIWGATEQKQRKARHVGQTQRIHAIYRHELRQLSEQCGPLNLERIGKAASTPFVPNVARGWSRDQESIGKAIDRLFAEFKVPKGFAKQAVDAALEPQNASNAGEPPLSHWSIANGLTWAARDTGFAADLVTAGELAATVVLAAGR